MLGEVGLAAALVVALFLAVPVNAQGQDAKLRVAHLSADAPDVDVYVNDDPVDELTGLSYKSVSSYQSLPEGTQNVKVYAAGETSEPVIETDVDLRGGSAYTVGAVGLVEGDSLTAQVYEDDNSLPGTGDTKLRAVHTVPDVAAVDIVPSGGDPLFTALGFPNSTSYAEVPADSYTLEVNAAGTDLSAFTIPEATLAAGSVYSVFVVGEAENGSLEVIATEDAGPSAGGEPIVLEVAEGDLPTATTPDTGGPSPILLYSAAVLISLGALGLILLRRA